MGTRIKAVAACSPELCRNEAVGFRRWNEAVAVTDGGNGATAKPCHSGSTNRSISFIETSLPVATKEQ